MDRVCSFTSVAEGLIVSLHNIHVRVLLKVPDSGINKLMHNSTRQIMIWRHVVARKSAALHEQFEQFELGFSLLKFFSQEVWPTSSE